MLKSIIRISIGVLVGLFIISQFDFLSPIQRTSSFITPYQLTATKGSRSPIIKLGTDLYSFICSGVVISKDFALTAAHCVVDSMGALDTGTIHISDVLGNYVNNSASAVAIEKLRDIALIKGDFSEFETYEVDWEGQYFTEMQTLSVVTSCGFPSGEGLTCQYLYYKGNYFFQIAFTGGPIFKGQSGGPVMLKKGDKWLVVGVNSGVVLNSVIIAPVVGAKSLLWGY